MLSQALGPGSSVGHHHPRRRRRRRRRCRKTWEKKINIVLIKLTIHQSWGCAATESLSP